MNEPHASHKSPILVDLGSRSKKAISRLRKGRGKLFDEIEDCIEELTTSGQISHGAQPVIVVVSERFEPSASFMPFGRNPFFGREKDD